MSKAESERRNTPDLRRIGASSIEQYFARNWHQVDITILPPGQKEVVPPGWHGAGLPYDAKVEFGDLLTTPVAGTELPPQEFTSWLAGRGFLFEYGSHWLSPAEAATQLASDKQTTDGIPVFRAWRRDGRSVPIEIEFYNGSRIDIMQQLTYLGNKGRLKDEERAAYSGIVANLIYPFISKGTTKVAEHLHVPAGYRRVARKDDCEATASTFTACKLVSMEMDKLEHRDEPLFWVDDVAIATTQAVVISILVAERYGIPLLIRAGAPSFGLGGSPEDLNYMRNTQPEMTRFGPLTSGDFGDAMIRTGQSSMEPALIRYGHGSPLRQTNFYPRGGGPIMDLMFRSLEQRNKRLQGIISITEAKRISYRSKYWAVVLNGIHAEHEDMYFPRYSIEPGAILLYGKQNDSMHRQFTERTVAKIIADNEDGFRVLAVEVEGRKQILYEPLPAK